MKKILKIILFTLLFIILILYYTLYTDSGKKFSYNVLSFIATQKIGLHTRVVELDLRDYPFIEAELLIAKKYKINIDGTYENKRFNLRYTMISNCIESDACKIKGDVDIKGFIDGPRKALTITGKGTALDGNITYVGVKHKHSFNDIHIDIQDINSSKLFKLLGQKAIFEGPANGYLNFDILSHKSRKGRLFYHVQDKDYHGVAVDLRAQIEVDNEKHSFTLEAKTSTASLHLLQGHYNQEKRKASAVYLLDIKNVADLKKLVKIDLNSPFYSVGKLSYAHKQLSMQGFSKSLGGMLDLFLRKDKLHFYLSDTPLSPLMTKLNLDPLFDTNITGKGTYDLKQKTVLFDASLSNVKFKQSKLTQSLFKSSEIDLSKENFDNNHLHIKTIDKEVSTTLSLANKTNHLILKDTQVNSDNHSVHSLIDLKMYKYNLKGNLYLKVDKYTASNDTYINFDGLIQKYYTLNLKGLVNKTWTSMDYSISAKRLPSHICTIVDDINVTGHINGPFKRLHIEGEGTALNGKVSYDGVQMGDKLENVTIDMKNIHAQKLSTLLGHPELPFGKVDLDANFDVLSTKRQKGDIHYILRKSKLFNLPFTLDTDVKVDNEKQKFTADITLGGAQINLKKGFHYLDKKQSEAFYTLNVPDLTSIEELLGYKYKGPFYAVGTVKYDGEYYAHGLSKTFDGLTEFDYNKERLDIDLTKVSFKRIMNLFPYPALLDAKTTGKIQYNFKKERLIVKTDLHNAKFKYAEVMDKIYQKSGVNMLKETFTNSTLDVKYQHKNILGNLIMENEHSHLSLTNTQIDTKHNTINAYFDVNMQKKEFSGKVYGSLDSPKINLNMQKLIRHEMDKQLDSIMGEGNRKMMENMPMGGMAKDVASGMGGAFMGMFF